MARKINSRAERKTKIPLGVKLISIFFYVSAALGLLSVIFSIAIIFNFFNISNLLLGRIFRLYSDKSIIVGIFKGIILCIASVLTAYGLWKLRYWAKILAILLSMLGIISLINSVIANYFYIKIGVQNPLTLIIYTLPGLIISFVIILYLVFSKKVREAFK